MEREREEKRGDSEKDKITKNTSGGGGGGGAVISNPKIYIAAFCHYKRFLGHVFRKKSATWFSENEGGGGGSKAVWNFSKKSSLLEMPSFPYDNQFRHLSNVSDSYKMPQTFIKCLKHLSDLSHSASLSWFSGLFFLPPSSSDAHIHSFFFLIGSLRKITLKDAWVNSYPQIDSFVVEVVEVGGLNCNLWMWWRWWWWW